MSTPKNRVCFYTVVTNDYDDLNKPLHMLAEVDYYIITDNPANQLRGFKTIVLPKSEDPVKQQRYIKAYPYDVLPGYQLYIYADASYSVRRNLRGLINTFKGGFGVKRHPSRDCIYKEAQAIIALGKADKELVQAQMYYARESMGIEDGFGLQETGILIRDASEQAKQLSYWWRAAIEPYTHRDQLALPMAIKTSGVQPFYMNRDVVNSYFKQHKHKAQPQPVQFIEPGQSHIAYIQPFASDMNIGREYNYHIETVRNGDWICLLDHDVTFLHPKTKQQIEDIVLKHGADFDLLGCMTNRIGSAHQRHNGVMSEDHNILNHIEIASKLHNEKYGEVKEIKQGVAGFLMLFRKSVWDVVKFEENTKHFDTMFCKAVRKNGGKLGLMTGVYVYHQYRPWAKDNPQMEQEHLKPVKYANSRPDSRKVLSNRAQ